MYWSWSIVPGYFTLNCWLVALDYTQKWEVHMVWNLKRHAYLWPNRLFYYVQLQRLSPIYFVLSTFHLVIDLYQNHRFYFHLFIHSNLVPNIVKSYTILEVDRTFLSSFSSDGISGLISLSSALNLVLVTKSPSNSGSGWKFSLEFWVVSNWWLIWFWKFDWVGDMGSNHAAGWIQVDLNVGLVDASN